MHLDDVNLLLEACYHPVLKLRDSMVHVTPFILIGNF